MARRDGEISFFYFSVPAQTAQLPAQCRARYITAAAVGQEMLCSAAYTYKNWNLIFFC